MTPAGARPRYPADLPRFTIELDGDMMTYLEDGRLLSETLIAATGHGRLYDGGRRDGWCN